MLGKCNIIFLFFALISAQILAKVILFNFGIDCGCFEKSGLGIHALLRRGSLNGGEN